MMDGTLEIESESTEITIKTMDRKFKIYSNEAITLRNAFGDSITVKYKRRSEL
jgi:hypothetical protein